MHGGVLAGGRGAAPIERARLAGDRETGVSIMRMNTGLDTGPVLARRSLPIVEDEDAGTLHDKLAALGADLMTASLLDLQAGRAQAKEQPAAGVTYARKIEKEETRLDWSRPASELERAVRAFRPSARAVSLVQGEALYIWRAR